jgi:hypothetical protein
MHPIFIVLLLFALMQLRRYRSMMYKKINRFLRPNPPVPETYTIASAPASSPGREQRIPLIIHQIMHSRNLPLDLYSTCLTNRHMNPEYEYRTYTLGHGPNALSPEVEEFATKFSPECAEALRKLLPGAFRADLLRCMLLYEYGGVYIDTKATTMIPLREMFGPESRLTAFLDYVPNCIHNGFIASEPKHPLVKRVIDRIVRNVQRGYYGECQLDITGPMVWGREFNLMLGKSEHYEFGEGSYPSAGVDLIGYFLTLPTNQVLIRSDNVPCVNRSVPGYYSVAKQLHPNNYSVRWYTGRVYAKET